jgi:deoxyribodipyrimidine photo-lyase
VSADPDEILLARRRPLNDAAPPGDAKSVVYVMSRDQRTRDNHALLAAQRHALVGRLPLIVVFLIYPQVRGRAREHFAFLLDGLADVAEDLSRHDIPFVIRRSTDPAAEVAEFGPAAVYVDFSPLRGPRRMRERLAASGVPVFEVDTHNVVPAWVASDKQEFAARTIRPKIHRHLHRFLVEPPRLRRHPYAWNGATHSVALGTIRRELLPTLVPDGTSVAATSGQVAAASALRGFVRNRLERYAVDRDDPTIDGLSGLSPYFHYGQLATLRVALSAPGADALIEEMVVRKELSDNFCLFQPHYDSLAGAPAWGSRTLAEHAGDPRPYVYSYAQLEQARTHDEAWNAAQRQMTRDGKMHGRMRMYWAKKILEWTPSAEVAIGYAIRLNDFYSIDGGDPNGYVGVLWSIAGLHDRPFAEREVFGQIRYMNEAGLRRKFALDAYVSRYPE